MKLASISRSRFPTRIAPVVGALACSTLLLAGCGGGGDDDSDRYPHADEPIGNVRQVYDGALTPDLSVNTFRNIDRLFPTRTIKASSSPYPLPRAATQLTDVKFTAGGRNYDMYDYLSQNRISALLILKNGQIVNETYQYGNTEKTRWMSMSVAKSITTTLAAAAIKDGQLNLADKTTKYVPALIGSAYEDTTVRNIMMMASGVKWNETYTDPTSDRRQLLEAQIAQKPGSAMALMAKLPRIAPPGSVNNYSTGETQVMGEVVIGATKKHLADYLSEKIWSKFGMEADANWWLDSPDGNEIGGSGISATLRDYGRFGLFIANDGVINGQSILPAGWVDEATTPKQLTTGNFQNYGYMWWVSTTPQSMADKAFYATGIFGQNIYIDRPQKVVIVTWGAQSKPSGAAVISNAAFFDAVVNALK
ncbi:serine hydrolase domain-containing protein [Piscinibacter koreensis]|uniref:serine hydrolase domain-containing protein n=1 Tax=Piscinibacter koreensis TaxID=2742824 RepID=UPI001FEA6F91|nr:serine hydrolase [Schlegelella koreensis]